MLGHSSEFSGASLGAWESSLVVGLRPSRLSQTLTLVLQYSAWSGSAGRPQGPPIAYLMYIWLDAVLCISQGQCEVYHMAFPTAAEYQWPFLAWDDADAAGARELLVERMDSSLRNNTQQTKQNV